MLSGFAAHEREVIRERSIAGTNRLAEAGTWLGGIVPYGYLQSRRERAREARLSMRHLETKLMLDGLADTYDKLAEGAERRNVPQHT